MRRRPLLSALVLLVVSTGAASEPAPPRIPTPVPTAEKPPAPGLERSERLSLVRVRSWRAEALALDLEHDGFDVLDVSARAGAVDVVVTRSELAALRRRGLDPALVARGRPLREIVAERAAAGGVPESYLDLAGIESAMASFAAGAPEICTLVDLTARYGLAPTEEGRHLMALKISGQVTAEEDEPAVLIVGAHHAREIVTPVLVLDAAQRLLGGYGKDGQITAAIDGAEIWLAPVWNPDGYHHVFTVDNLWRKNRRDFEESIGVDLNRNYPLGWSGECAGDEDPDSQTYKGPEAASEAETHTMMAWSAEQRFAKVIDYHTHGQEVLHGYECMIHPLAAYLEAEALAVAEAVGYPGEIRPPSAEGEHYQWQMGSMAAYAFLIETAHSHQPEYEVALFEAGTVWPGTLWMIERAIPLRGHVTDANTGAPLAAGIRMEEIAFENGERIESGGPFGAYHAFLPGGEYDLVFEAPGYFPESFSVTIVDGASVQLEVSLIRIGCDVADVDGSGDVGFNDLLSVLSNWGTCEACPQDVNLDGEVGFGDLLEILSRWGPCPG